MTNVDIAIIGGGVVGNAVAYELSRSTNKEIVLLERNPGICQGENQSTRNSGVMHAGIYYDHRKSPLKAKYCVEGNAMLYDFCQEHRVPHQRVGKLVVAVDKREEEYLDNTLRMAKENRVPNVRKITGEEAKRMEPNVFCTAALYVPTSGIIDAPQLVYRLHTLAERNNVITATNSKVVGINATKDGFALDIQRGVEHETLETRLLINCAGLYADEIAKMVNPDSPYEMEPLRGEAAKFYKNKREDIAMTGMNVYPAPYARYVASGERAAISFAEFKRLAAEGKVALTLGIHLTPTLSVDDGEYSVGNTVTVGPTMRGGFGKENYSQGLKDHCYFQQNVERYFPNLKPDDTELHQAGIMARLKDHTDWVIAYDEKHPRCLNLLGMDSPALTSSLAIAQYVREMVR